MSRGRVTAAVALIAVLAAALVFVLLRDRGADGAPSATVATSSATSDTATLSATPSQAQPVAVPTPDTTGNDFNRIIREQMAFFDWLHANPDPDLVRMIYHPQCACHSNAREAMSFYEENGLSLRNLSTTVHQVSISEQVDDRLAILRVDFERSGDAVVDETGAAVQDVEPTVRAEYDVTVIREGRRWLIRDMYKVVEKS